MPQIFHPSTNTLSRLSIFGALALVFLVLFALDLVNRTSYVTQERVARAQPVQFSHQHHVGQLGIDCRYCHSTVERSAVAGLPSTQTCMNCHAQIWADSDFLAPVRSSWRSNRAIPWVKVHDLPDFVYFDHSVHVAKGIGCVSCHGRVDRMNQLWQATSLQMGWCLDCHRHPEAHVRPRDKIFDLAWQPDDQAQLGAELVREYAVHARTDCTACHR